MILESPSDGSKPEIQEERVMELKIFFYVFSAVVERGPANWVRLCATS